MLPINTKATSYFCERQKKIIRVCPTLCEYVFALELNENSTSSTHATRASASSSAKRLFIFLTVQTIPIVII